MLFFTPNKEQSLHLIFEALYFDIAVCCFETALFKKRIKQNSKATSFTVYNPESAWVALKKAFETMLSHETNHGVLDQAISITTFSENVFQSIKIPKIPKEHSIVWSTKICNELSLNYLDEIFSLFNAMRSQQDIVPEYEELILPNTLYIQVDALVLLLRLNDHSVLNRHHITTVSHLFQNSRCEKSVLNIGWDIHATSADELSDMQDDQVAIFTLSENEKTRFLR